MLGNRALNLFRSVGVAGIGLVLGFSSLATAASVEVKSVVVDARLMKFPSISLDGIAYDALTFEYAVDGGVEVVAINTAMETLQCGGQSRQHHYLAVDYRGPEVIFRVTDQRKNRVLLLQKIDTDGTYAYGQGACEDNGDLNARFQQGKSIWQTELKNKLLARARTQMEEFMQKNTTLHYADLRFPLFYFSADGSRYESLNRAFDRARDAFDLSVQFGITQEADDMLQLVAATWEKDLIATAAVKTPPPDSDKVRLALHRNLTYVYLFLRKFDLARRHDAMALSKGMPEQESQQALILENERRTILSPQVSANVVLTANLFRYGQNVIREAQLVEVDNFAELKQALSQR